MSILKRLRDLWPSPSKLARGRFGSKALAEGKLGLAIRAVLTCPTSS
jgi:hypothetical protein